MTEGPLLVTGGAGYIGFPVCDLLLRTGLPVRVLDSALHGQEDLCRRLDAMGAEVIRGDLRDAEARRRAVNRARGIVHLAAIVGDPACARNPDLSRVVNVDGSRGLLEDARRAGVERFVFASTCSNYGRIADPNVPIDEHGQLSPVSLYAEQKVSVERMLLSSQDGGPAITCLRFATIYGAAPRMRFDLTVNEFTRDLWADRDLEVFGEQFWRPYVHVRDAARAVALVLATDAEATAGQVFNVGSSSENYRKVDLVREVQRQLDTGRVKYVHRDEDPRDYKVSFEKIRSQLGFEVTMTVPAGIQEIIQALSAQEFPDPFGPRYRN